MHQMKNFQTLADLSKNYYSFFNITRNFDGLKATFSYLINRPFQQIKLQTYFILYISYCKQYFYLADCCWDMFYLGILSEEFLNKSRLTCKQYFYINIAEQFLVHTPLPGIVVATPPPIRGQMEANSKSTFRNYSTNHMLVVFQYMYLFSCQGFSFRLQNLVLFLPSFR